MKRNIITSIVLLSVLIGLGYYVYNKAEEEALLQKTNLSFIPNDDTFLIVDIKNISEQVQQVFSSNLIWADFITNKEELKEIETHINQYDSLFDKRNISLINTSIAFIGNDSNSIDFLLVSELSKSFNIDSLPNESNTNEAGIYELSLSEKSLFVTYKNERLICSNTITLLTKKDFKTIESDSVFNRVYKTRAQKNNSLFLYANLAKVNSIFNLNFEKHIKNSTWSAFDLKTSQDAISGNGFLVNSSLNGESKTYSENFLNITPSTIKNIVVSNFNSINELEISEEIINKNNELCNCDFLTDGLGWIDNQIIYLTTTFNDANFVAFKLKDVNSFNLAINYFTDYFPSEIMIDSAHFIKSFVSKVNFREVLSKEIELNNYTIYNNYAIFSNSANNIKQLLYELNDNRKFKNNEESYEFYSANSSKNSFYKKIQKGFLLNEKISENGISIIESSVKKDNLVYTNFSYSKEINLGGTYYAPKWQLYFDNPLFESIYFVDNHKTNDKDILIQDTTNTIYLISTSGNLKWKRKINGKIINKITKVDIYQNGKYQMLFNTKNKLYLIDVLGRDVDNFPKNINGATNAVSAIDYNKNGDYRFLVSTQDGILSFNKDGNMIDGWKKPLTDTVTKTQVRHLLANTKDYLFTNDINGKVYLYSRQGEIRHSVKSPFTGSFFPIDIGNTIEESRGIYWDEKRKELRKHFFSNEINTILSLPDSIIQFHYLNFYTNKTEKNYVLETKNELYIFDKGGNTIEIIQLNPDHKNLTISKNHISYINKITNDFILLDKKGDEILRSSNVSFYNIDNSTSKTRILMLSNNKLQMIIPK